MRQQGGLAREPADSLLCRQFHRGIEPVVELLGLLGQHRSGDELLVGDSCERRGDRRFFRHCRHTGTVTSIFRHLQAQNLAAQVKLDSIALFVDLSHRLGALVPVRRFGGGHHRSRCGQCC